MDSQIITIGDRVLIGPGCYIITVNHSADLEERFTGVFDNKPVTIGKGVWLGANVTVLPGVTIGEASVIGAGSVVTKDIPPRVIAAGNPCHVIREISEADKILGKYPESDVMEVQRRVAEIQEELNYRQTEQ